MCKGIWKKLLRIERRATYIGGCILQTFTDNCYRELIQKAKDTSHPLNELICVTVERQGKKNIAPVFAKTTCLKDFFTYYASLCTFASHLCFTFDA
jgi:hypothetical protein